MKKKLAILLSLMTVCMFSFAGCGQSDNQDESDAKTALKLSEPPMPFALSLGINDDGSINYTAVDENAKCQVWNADKKEFEDAELTNDVVRGNFVQLSDSDDNKKADLVEIVKFEDAEGYWDSSMAWKKGVAAKAEPALDDKEAFKVYDDESTLPYGERLLTGFGVGDWAGVTDFQNSDNITYWTDNDYYNMTSGGSLTILPQYKTYQQPNGWSCGCCSGICALEWYGLRNGLNDVDLGMLRETYTLECGTDVKYLQNAFKNLAELGITGEWEFISSDDDSELLGDPAWVKDQLQAGHPIMVEWNPFGWHWQTIIGYDDMDTEDTLDDVLIMMDSYDTTDQNNDGYYVESYERVVYGTCTSSYDKEAGTAKKSNVTGTQFLVAYPTNWSYEMKKGDGIAADKSNVGVFTDSNKMSYGKTADDIQKYYADATKLGEDEEGCLPIADNGLGGAAASNYERTGDHDNSPYYKFMDFYNMKSTDTLHMLTNFKTLQQASEYSCGATSAAMVTNWFGMNEGETDMSLMHARQEGELGGTFLDGMEQIFQYMNDTYNQDWVWVDTKNLDDPDGEESYVGDYCLQAGTAEDWYGLIPYLLDNGIPIMIGWDEWGGHWQVIVGYDDMGTVDKTEDDVLILADPYDTTDHNQDGYLIEGFERLVYGYYSSFEEKYTHNDFIAAFPKTGHEEVIKALGLEQ